MVDTNALLPFADWGEWEEDFEKTFAPVQVEPPMAAQFVADVQILIDRGASLGSAITATLKNYPTAEKITRFPDKTEAILHTDGNQQRFVVNVNI